MSIKNEYQQHNFLSNTGFGTVSPTEKVDVSGNTNVTGSYKINGTDVLTANTLGSGISSSSLTSVGTLGSLNISGNLTVDTNTLFVDSVNNFVGIGTSNPGFRLDIGENISNSVDEIVRIRSRRFAGIQINGDTGNLSGEPGGAYVRLSQDGDTVNGILSILQSVGQDGSGGSATGTLENSVYLANQYDDTLAPGHLQFGTRNTVRMTIRENGRVGIGTNNPSGNLEVSISPGTHFTDQSLGSIAIGNATGGSTGQVIPNISGKSTGENLSGLFFTAGSSNTNSTPDMRFDVRTITNTAFSTLTSRAFSFSTFNNPLMTILRNGDVGIGTTNPTEKLHVIGNLNLSTGSSFKINGTDVLTGSGLGTGVISSSLTSVGTLSTLLVSGNVGIGITNPDTKLQVVGNMQVGESFIGLQGGRMRIRSSENDHLVMVNTGKRAYRLGVDTSSKFRIDDMDDNESNRLCITSAGNVGIGITNPSLLLHVEGDARISTTSLSTSFDKATIGTLNIQGPVLNTGDTTSYTNLGQAITFRSNTVPRYSGNIIETVAAIRSAYDTSGVDTISGGHALQFWTFSGWGSTGGGTLTERMRVASSGNVGIGTTNPGSLLHVNGNVQVGDAVLPQPSGTAPLYAARAWVTFSSAPGNNREVLGSGNVSSITREDIGNYTVNFLVPMHSPTYSVNITSSGTASIGPSEVGSVIRGTVLVGSVGVRFGDTGGTRTDISPYNSVTIVA